MITEQSKEGGLSLESTATLSLKEVIDRTSAVDVTKDKNLLEMARREVAIQYSRLSSQELTEEAVYLDLCEDGYDNSGNSITVATLTRDFYGRDILSGTVRLVKGTDRDTKELPSLDAMNLFNVSEWPHRVENIPDSKVGELGRFVINSSFRTEVMDGVGIPNIITRELYFKTLSLGREQVGIARLYAIMPDYVVNRVVNAGINVREITNASLRTDEHALEIYDKYDIYWKRMKPKLYEFLTY